MILLKSAFFSKGFIYRMRLTTVVALAFYPAASKPKPLKHTHTHTRIHTKQFASIVAGFLRPPFVGFGLTNRIRLFGCKKATPFVSLFVLLSPVRRRCRLVAHEASHSSTVVHRRRSTVYCSRQYTARECESARINNTTQHNKPATLRDIQTSSRLGLIGSRRQKGLQ